MRHAVVVLAACARMQSVHLDASSPDASDASVAPASWRAQVIYLAMTDRFRDGDPSNDRAGDASCYTPTVPKGFHGGDFAGLRANLGYLQDLGATALWITPVNVQTHCGYHGYYIDFTDPSDDAIEPKLGTSAELSGLSDDLHARGMRLVLDLVVNHSGNDARITAQHPGWFHDPTTCSGLGNPDVYCPIGGHPDFAQEQPQVAAYLSQVWARVIARYHVDGIRMDTAKHVPTSYFATSFFPIAHPGFAVAEIWDSAQAFAPYLDAGFSSAFHFPLYYALDSALAKGGSADAIASAIADGITQVGAERAKSLVLFADNHDVPRFATEAGAIDPDEIDRRLMLALDLIFTLPGIPQLYYGDELAMYGGADPDNRHDFPAWATDSAQRGTAHPTDAAGNSSTVFARVQLLSRLRRTDPAFADGDYRELWRPNGGQNVFAFARGTGTGTRIVAICNEAVPCSVDAPAHLADGTQLSDELFDGAPAAITVTSGKLALQLPAKSAAIYRVE